MRCEYCQKEFPIDDERMVGQDIKCPHCGIPCHCSDRRVIIICPACHRDMEGELWMLGNHAECTYCHKEILLSRPPNPDDEYSNSYLPGNYVLGNYTIKRCVGAGGMGEVYLARHNFLERDYALKLLRPDRSGTIGDVSLESLIREARLACQVQSPHIISVTDVQVDTERNLSYIVMEYVEGRNIESMICEQPLDESFVIEVARGVCQGLIAAADYDIVHRDIKPANIMLTDGGVVKLADLGIAKSGKDNSNKSGGKIVGTVNYCAPEQLLASDDVDVRADIYSLGATMYHMLSGRRPFEAHNTKTVISKVLKGDLLPLSKVAPLVSKDCCKLVNAMMNMNVDKRPADAKKLLAALDIIVKKRSHKFLSYLPFYSKFAALTKMKKFFVLAAASAVILLAGAGGIALAVGQGRSESENLNEQKMLELLTTETAKSPRTADGKKAPSDTGAKPAEKEKTATDATADAKPAEKSTVNAPAMQPDPIVIVKNTGEKAADRKHTVRSVKTRKKIVSRSVKTKRVKTVQQPLAPVRPAQYDEVIPEGVEELAEGIKNTKAGRIGQKIIQIEMVKIIEEGKKAKTGTQTDESAPGNLVEAIQTAAAKAKPAESAPVETTSAESTPAETKPAESAPAETKPAESAPAETKPAENKPAESAPAETKPAENKPAETKPAAAQPQNKTTAAQVDRGSSKVGFIKLLCLVLWIFSGIKVMSYLVKNARQNNSFVIRNAEVLNLASLIAGPIVYLIVEYHKKFGSRIKKLSFKKEPLPIIVDNHGNPAFMEGDSSGDSDVVYYVRKMLANALQLHASDIFIDPKTGEVSVIRFRVDGALRVIEEINFEFGNRVINVFKVAGGMDISERRRPQDGAFSLTGPFGDVSLRVATVGAFSGEKIALRILGDDSGPKSLSAAGLTGTELATMEQAAKLPSGMVLICGPTGSGKTTTLYAMLNSIDYSIKNVISIEDPIEHVIPAISQMEVNESAGIGFSQLLRNALRQNPDIICLGEIRDEDTAQTAIHAAQTGHLIIATLHSNDNIGTIDRLANLNIPLRSIAGTLRVVVSQRLVRKLCSCKKPVAPSEEDRLQFGQFGISCSKLYEPKGCPKCGNTGYSGRVALFDILTVDDDLRELLEDEHTNLSNIQKRLKKGTGGSAMIRSGYVLAAKGITSTEEVRRVTMEIKN